MPQPPAKPGLATLPSRRRQTALCERVDAKEAIEAGPAGADVDAERDRDELGILLAAVEKVDDPEQLDGDACAPRLAWTQEHDIERRPVGRLDLWDAAVIVGARHRRVEVDVALGVSLGEATPRDLDEGLEDARETVEREFLVVVVVVVAVVAVGAGPGVSSRFKLTHDLTAEHGPDSTKPRARPLPGWSQDDRV